MVTTWGSIPYFSNPRLSYQGVPIGTMAHHDVARTINENRERVENTYDPFRGVELTLYSGTNLQGSSCPVSIRLTSPVNVASQCSGQAVRSFKVRGYEGGEKLCFYNGPGDRHVCYRGGASSPREFVVVDIDSTNVPQGFVRTFKGERWQAKLLMRCTGVTGYSCSQQLTSKNRFVGSARIWPIISLLICQVV